VSVVPPVPTGHSDPVLDAPLPAVAGAPERRAEPLVLGSHQVWPPVVLAPMAGVTNPAFRRLCREQADAAVARQPRSDRADRSDRSAPASLAGLFVSEMITARGLVEGADQSWARAAFDDDEPLRSIQLYGSDPAAMGEAVRRLVEVGHVDHVDLNLGCPVRKITRHGGGAALTARPRLLAALIGAAVDAASTAGDRPVPVTVKFRTGIDDDLLTFTTTGRVAEDAGCAAVALHGRTAAQLYSGAADWAAIAALKEHVTSIPVLGNGDIWAAEDAARMMHETGCDGVVIGRGCLGRPWLFRDLVDQFEGRTIRDAPPLGAVAETLATHLALLVDLMGPERGLRDIRKHVGWYLAGYPVGAEVRRTLAATAGVAEFRACLDALDPTLARAADHDGRRGTQRGPQKVTLPHGWLDDRDSAAPPSRGAEALTSGG